MWVLTSEHVVEKVHGSLTRALQVAAELALLESEWNRALPAKCSVTLEGIASSLKKIDSLPVGNEAIKIQLSIQIDKGETMTKSERLAKFYRDNCKPCTAPGNQCPFDMTIKKCLRHDHLVVLFDGEMFSQRPDYKPTDSRHWSSEGNLTKEELDELLRCNA